MACVQKGMGITAIAEHLHLSPTFVRKCVYAGAFPGRSDHRHRQSQLAVYLPYLQQQVQAGCTNASQLWRAIRDQGFSLGYNVVNAWLRAYVEKPGRRSLAREQARREALTTLLPTGIPVATQAEIIMAPTVMDNQEPLKSPRHLAWLLLREPTSLNRSEQEILAFICQEKGIDETYLLAQQFLIMIRKRQGDTFDGWLHACCSNGVPDRQTFAEGLQREYAAVKAALLLPYSNDYVAYCTSSLE